MNRLLVTLLAAFDAVIVVAVGLAAALAPLTLMWVFAFDGGAQWTALWPAAARVWQVGHFVPLSIDLDLADASAAGIPADGAAFEFSLAPLAFAAFTAIFAARSGARAARAGAWVVGVGAGTVTVAALSALVAVTSSLQVVSVETGAAVALPTLVFGVASLAGALVGAWRAGDRGVLDRLRHRIDLDDTGVVDAAARGIATSIVGLLGLGAAVTALGMLLRGGGIVALFEAAHLDLVGVVVMGLGQLAYLPTLIAWGAAYAAGPGFALGTGATVAPGGTNVGVVPGIPVLGAVPESPSAWLLLLALGVVGAGVLAGWVARARLRVADGDEPLPARIAVLVTIVAGSAGGAALVAAVSSGSLGPGRLEHVGPAAGTLALVVAVEVALGAAAMLLAPRSEEAASRPVPAWQGREPAATPPSPDDGWFATLGEAHVAPAAPADEPMPIGTATRAPAGEAARTARDDDEETVDLAESLGFLAPDAEVAPGPDAASGAHDARGLHDAPGPDGADGEAPGDGGRR